MSGKSRASRIIALILIVLSIVLMVVYTHEGNSGVLHGMQNSVRTVFVPLRFLGAAGGSLVEDATTMASDNMADAETLSELKERNAELTEMVTRAEEYRLEAERLQALLNLKDAYDINGITGRVIGKSTDAWNQTITLDVGTSNGVEEGLTVIGRGGVIGQVVAVSNGSCTVRLLSDPKSGVAAMIQSSRVEGIIRGSLTGLLYLENVSDNDKVSVGDVVLTSGLGGSFAKGLLIGTVARVEGNAFDGTRSILVSQNSDVRALEEVIVVFSAANSYDDAKLKANDADDSTEPADDNNDNGDGDQ